MQFHIGLLLRNLNMGGVEQNTLRLARGLLDRGHAVDLVVFEKDGPLEDQIPNGVRVIDLGARRVLTGSPRLVSYLRKEAPNVLISAKEYINVVAIWARFIARAPTKVIVSTRTQISNYQAYNRQSMKGRSACRHISFSYRKADAIVAVSNSVADDLSQTVSILRSDIHVIYNPIISDETILKSQEEVELRWLQSNNRIPTILAAGRLSPEKDFETLIRAFAIVVEKMDARLIIIGSGEEEANLKALIRTLGLEEKVDLPGFTDNPFKYMARADVFVLSSRWEGFGNVLVEAMSVGTAVVSTESGGPNEILMGGQFGKLVPIDDPVEMSNAILSTLSAPPDEKRLIERAEEFSVENVVAQYEMLIVSVFQP